MTARRPTAAETAGSGGSLHILIVSDAWHPQVNGVVRTLVATCGVLREWGHRVSMVTPEQFHSLPCPSYPEIRLALAPPRSVARRIAEIDPQAVHIATEGPLGLAARRYCMARGIPFSTAYHTRFPEYLARRVHLPAKIFWPYVRRFHGPAQTVMAATGSLEAELRAQGLTRTHRWSRGVDLSQFGPDAPPPSEFASLPRPIQLYVGRVAVEKNLEAFLSNGYPGSKVVVGDGPARAALAAAYPDAVFLGCRQGRELAGCYAGADVFVFPSRTDTFGLVIIEALACGTPVAGFPVPGPLDIVTNDCGGLAEDLERAIDAALYCKSGDCLGQASKYTWENATSQFLAGLVPLTEEVPFAA